MYKANITSTSQNQRNKIYYGISENFTNFTNLISENITKNSRHDKQTNENIFKNRKYKTVTELSNEICKLKEQKKSYWKHLGVGERSICGWTGNEDFQYSISTTLDGAGNYWEK